MSERINSVEPTTNQAAKKQDQSWIIWLVLAIIFPPSVIIWIIVAMSKKYPKWNWSGTVGLILVIGGAIAFGYFVYTIHNYEPIKNPILGILGGRADALILQYTLENTLYTSFALSGLGLLFSIIGLFINRPRKIAVAGLITALVAGLLYYLLHVS
jgi:hypothetical protein